MVLLNSMSQRQSMRLTMTPQLLQAIHILQFSTTDLANYVQEQSSQNPLMEVIWDHDSFNRNRKRHAASPDREGNAFDLLELVTCPDESLEAELLSQLRIQGVTDTDYKIAEFMAGNLNENGFLTVTVQEASQFLREPIQKIEAVLKLLQSLEPAGVAAQSLQECLLLQIDRDDEADEWAHALVSRFFNELGSGKLQRVADSLGIGLEQVKQSLSYIRILNPRPGLPYNFQPKKYIQPDAVVQKDQDRGRYIIQMNDACLPRVSIRSYYQGLKEVSENQEVKAFFQQNVQSARSLIYSLEQRKQTLIRLIEAIVEEQYMFLEKGICYLKPMNLLTIAEKLKLHESTISRSVQNKYIQTPRGIFELKFFFTNGLETAEGEIVSSKSIKSRIRGLIDKENKSNPLSDQQIADQLKKESFQISRRTVMKYREEMRILSSRLRK